MVKIPVSTNVAVHFSYVLDKGVLFVVIIIQTWQENFSSISSLSFTKQWKLKKKKISHRLKAEDIYTFLLRVLMVSRVTVFPQFSNLLISELSRTIVKQQADEQVARWNCICMTTKWQPLSGTILKSIWQLWFFVGSKGRGTNNSNIEIENLLKIVQTTEMRS